MMRSAEKYWAAGIAAVALVQTFMLGSILIAKSSNHGPLHVKHGDLVEEAGHAQHTATKQEVTGAAAESRSKTVDPMPGVHMVYMYVNGSDPAIVNGRVKAGGSAKGACSQMLKPTRFVPHRFSRDLAHID